MHRGASTSFMQTKAQTQHYETQNQVTHEGDIVCFDGVAHILTEILSRKQFTVRSKFCLSYICKNVNRLGLRL